MKKKRINISMSDDTKDRLLQFAYENHLTGGLSGALEYIAWHVIKVKNEVPKGQLKLFDDNKL